MAMSKEEQAKALKICQDIVAKFRAAKNAKSKDFLEVADAAYEHIQGKPRKEQIEIVLLLMRYVNSNWGYSIGMNTAVPAMSRIIPEFILSFVYLASDSLSAKHHPGRSEGQRAEELLDLVLEKSPMAKSAPIKPLEKVKIEIIPTDQLYAEQLKDMIQYAEQLHGILKSLLTSEAIDVGELENYSSELTEALISINRIKARIPKKITETEIKPMIDVSIQLVDIGTRIQRSLSKETPAEAKQVEEISQSFINKFLASVANLINSIASFFKPKQEEVHTKEKEFEPKRNLYTVDRKQTIDQKLKVAAEMIAEHERFIETAQETKELVADTKPKKVNVHAAAKKSVGNALSNMRAANSFLKKRLSRPKKTGDKVSALVKASAATVEAGKTIAEACTEISGQNPAYFEEAHASYTVKNIDATSTVVEDSRAEIDANTLQAFDDLKGKIYTRANNLIGKSKS